MWAWIKKNRTIILTTIVSVSLCIWLYACESKVKSLTEPTRLVNRAELQLELDRFMGMARIRMLDLDRQDAFRDLIIQNSLSLVSGVPFNPVALITGVLGIYGLAHATTKTSKAVVKKIQKQGVKSG
ncbi:unnamed protein product [marine sediment metagenome]|uniref:Uncharacterized protein n=1 Tax=marine sediment metagenome TaxID=412755 RepID=X1IBE2_9ZZZZ